MRERDIDVAVIGAGIAGLVAARELQEHGFSVVVFEASNEVGGRCKPGKNKSGIEAGAEFIHGEDAVTWRLVERFALRTVRFPNEKFPPRRYWFTNELPPIFAKYVDELCEACENPAFLTEGSVGDFISTFDSWDGEPGGELQSQTEWKHLIREFARERIERLEGCNTFDLRHLDYIEQCSLSSVATQNFRLVAGYGELVEKICEGLDIRTGAAIDSIEIGEAQVRLASAGFEFYATRAVLAIPLSQYQNDSISFRPGLPNSKTSAIKNLRLGQALKVCVSLKDTQMDFSLLHTLEQIPTWMNLPSRLTDGSETLIGFVGGESAQRLLGFTDEHIAQIAMTSLLKAIPTLSKENIVEPIEVVRWDTAPYISGSYSFPLRGGSSTSKELASPFGRLHFAGECTSFNGNIGTVHGAIESGYRASAEIKFAANSD